MRNDKLTLALVVAATLAASGCTQMTLREDFGQSTAINIANQAVNPNALDQVPAANSVDGQKIEKGIDRYRADRPDASRAKLLSEMGN